MPMSGDDYPIPDGPVENPGLWRGNELAASGAYVQRIDGDAVAELGRALGAAKDRGHDGPGFGKDDFPLPGLSGLLEGILNELETGRGFVVLRGFPAADYGEADTQMIFWGLGQHLGTPNSQNADGHLLGHVRDLGFDVNDTKVRNYQTTAELRLHNDLCDVLGLMCLRPAKSGGRSRLASVPAISNSMLAERPDLLRELYRPMCIDRRGEAGRPDEDDRPWYVMPVFNYHAGLISARFPPRAYYDSAQRFDGVPPLTAAQTEALDLLEETARRPENSFSYDLEPGDIQFANNYCIFHARTDFEDFPEPDRKRHMLRLWLSTPNSRPLPPWFEKRFGSVAPGVARGGIYPWRGLEAAS
jgi:hypothetical protein